MSGPIHLVKFTGRATSRKNLFFSLIVLYSDRQPVASRRPELKFPPTVLPSPYY